MNEKDLAKQMLWWARQSCEDVIKDINQFPLDKALMLTIAESLDTVVKGLRVNAIQMKS